MPTETVDEVLAALDSVIEGAWLERSPVGYFASMYRTVTATVKDGLDSGLFDDPERMQALDVVFANRYLEAIAARGASPGPTESWQTTFDAAGRWRPIVLQHLLVAINAHINLDLGIAAAEVAPGEALPDLRQDYERINEILGALVETVRTHVVKVSPWMGLAERFSGRDDAIVRFSIVVARREAWRFANRLAPLPLDQWEGPVAERDAEVARLARRMLRPGMLSVALLPVRLRERADVREVIDVLRAMPAPDLADIEARVRRRQTGGR